MSEWQPIETVPQDHMPRLYLCRGKVVQGFVDATGQLTVQHEFGWRAMRRKPSHWMPLPRRPGASVNPYIPDSPEMAAQILASMQRYFVYSEPCCVCGSIVDTRENGTPGAEVMNGEWACSEACWEVAAGDP